MTSNATVRIMSMVTKVAFRFRIIHFHTKVMRAKDGGHRVKFVYESQLHFWQRLTMVTCNLLIRGCLCAYGIWFDLNTPDLGQAESFTFYVVLMVDAMCAFLLLSMTFFGHLFSQMIEAFASMERKLRKIHSVTGDEPDGAEQILKVIIAMMASVTACIPLINTQLVQLEIHVFAVVNTPFGLGAAVFAAGGTLHIFMDWVLMCIVVQGALVYVNSTLRWLKLLRWSEDLPSGKKDVMLLAYRMLQVMHVFATQSSSAIIAIALFIDALLMITILVLLIGFPAQLNPFLSFGFWITFIIAVLATKLLLDLATHIADCSAEFTNSFRRNDYSLSPTQARALKTCPPLTLSISQFSVISRGTFPFLMSDIVVSQVVDILVGLKQVAI